MSANSRTSSRPNLNVRYRIKWASVTASIRMAVHLLALVLVLSSPCALAQDEAQEVKFVKAASSLGQVTKAVKLSLIDREWELQKEDENSIQAIHRFGRFTWISVIITFDTSKASVAYLDSSGNADSRFQSWIGYLAKDISGNLQRLQVLFD